MKFIVYVHPQPQGSAKAFVMGKRAIITSDNKKLKPFRNEVTAVVLRECNVRDVTVPFAGKHIPAHLSLDFYFERLPSIPKKRTQVVVKPDIDKLARATLDSLTGVLFMDDAQVVTLSARKHYGSPERVEIGIELSQCLGYPDCDGDLVATPHEKNCPRYEPEAS
jgi:crossover junction endodeoxyribonuclease RusA